MKLFFNRSTKYSVAWFNHFVVLLSRFQILSQCFKEKHVFPKNNCLSLYTTRLMSFPTGATLRVR